MNNIVVLIIEVVAPLSEAVDLHVECWQARTPVIECTESSLARTTYDFVINKTGKKIVNLTSLRLSMKLWDVDD